MWGGGGGGEGEGVCTYQQLCILNILDVSVLFSGSDIVQWMMSKISGIKSYADATKLGQMLLDSGALFHTEGSRYESVNCSYFITIVHCIGQLFTFTLYKNLQKYGALVLKSHDT